MRDFEKKFMKIPTFQSVILTGLSTKINGGCRSVFRSVDFFRLFIVNFFVILRLELKFNQFDVIRFL